MEMMVATYCRDDSLEFMTSMNDLSAYEACGLAEHAGVNLVNETCLFCHGNKVDGADE